MHSSNPAKVSQISDLIELVKNNELRKIEELIQREHAEKGRRWQLSDELFVQRAFRDALVLGRLEAAEIFLKAELPPEGSAPEEEKTDRKKFIYFAIKAGNKSAVELLVKYGLQVTDKDLIHAVEERQAQIVEFLLQKGIGPRGVIWKRFKERDTLLAYAAVHNQIQIIESLLKYGGVDEMESSFLLAYEKYGTQIEKIRDMLGYTYNETGKNAFLTKIASNPDTYAEIRLESFVKEKADLEQKLSQLNSSFEKIIKTLMNYAVGVDLSSALGSTLSGVLKSAAGINFIGVSFDGRPATREMLLSMGFLNVDEAIVTLDDLDKLPNQGEPLRTRINTQIEKQGGVIKDKLVNLVPLWAAAQIGDLETVNARLTANIDPNEEGGSEKAPIVWAAQYNHQAVVAALLKCPQLDRKILPDTIEAAQHEGHHQLAEQLIIEQNINQIDENGDTLLCRAVEKGSVSEVKNLLARKADVNQLGRYGYPLYIAARKSYSEFRCQSSENYIEILKLLLNKGADPNLVYCCQTAMEAAGKAASAEAFAMLLPITDKKEFVQQHGNNRGETFPWYTEIMFDCLSSSESLQILTLLKEQGANFNQWSAYGEDTLLSTAFSLFPKFTFSEDEYVNNKTFQPHLTLINFLLDQGADPNQKIGVREDTALHELICQIDLELHPEDYLPVFDKCLAKGFDINAVNSTGETLLHTVVKLYFSNNRSSMDPCSRACTVLIDYLLKHQANPSIKNNQGQTPLEYLEIISSGWYHWHSKNWDVDAQQKMSTSLNKTISMLEAASSANQPTNTSQYTNNAVLFPKVNNMTVAQDTNNTQHEPNKKSHRRRCTLM